MPKLNVEKGRAMLKWAGAVLEETVPSFQSLRDGQIFCRMLSIAQRSPEEDYEEYDISKASLEEAYNILEKMFAIEVMDKLDLNLALNGDETELTKFLLLVLAVGVKSPLSRCFTAPSLTLNSHNQNLILFVMGHAFRDCKHLHDMAANFYDGLMLDTTDGLHVTPQRIESPMDASTPVTSKVLRKSILTPDSVAVVCGSPRVNEEIADVPITTMLRMRHHRICQFEQKLTKEKNLRSEIEAELQLKEDLIDSKAEVIRKLEDKIIFLEKTAKEMKEDQIFYSREMSDLRKAHEEKIAELKCRYEGMITELEEFKARNAFLEKENEDVWKEVHHWRKLQETLEKYKGMEEVLSRTTSDNDELRIKEKHYKRCMEELQLEVQSLSSTLESERECYREKINSMKSQHEKSWLPESAECLGNIIEEDLKNKIDLLQKQLEEKELASEELERELLMANSTLQQEIKSLVSERTELQEINIKSEAKIQLQLDEVKSLSLKVQTLEDSNTSLESRIMEKVESLNCLRGELENLKFDLQGKVENILMLEANIEGLRDSLKASEHSAESLRLAEALKLKELQELESKYKDLFQLLEMERTKKSEVEGVLNSLKSEREALLSDVKDISEKLNSLENANEMIKAANDELECQLVNKNGLINSLEANLSESKERFEQLSRDSSHSSKQLDCEIQSKVKEIDRMKGEISHLELTLQKMSDELTVKDGLLKKSDILAEQLANEVQTLSTDLKKSEAAFTSLNSDHLSLNKEVTELKSQGLITEKSRVELTDSLKLKSQQIEELQERVGDSEKKLESERILFNEREEHLKDELQKSVQTQKILEEKCHLLLSKTTEQEDIIQKVKLDAKCLTDEMKRKLDEALSNVRDVETLNNKLDEKDQQLNLCLELEAKVKDEIQILKQENDLMKCQLSKQEREMNDFNLLKRGYETKLAMLEDNFKSLQKSSEGSKDFLATQRQLIQKLETKSKDDDFRILELTKKLQENQEEMNNEAKFLASRLKSEIAEKENMRLALETLSDDNSRLRNEFEKMQASHSQNVSAVEVRIRNEVAHENQQLREAVREKEAEIFNYKQQVENCQNEEFIMEKLQQSENYNHSLTLSLQDAKIALQERQQEMGELKTERDALNDEVSRLQKEVDDMKMEVQKNNREMKRLNDELSSSQIVANRMKSNETEMRQIASLLQDQREILSLSRTSSKTRNNEACVTMRQQLEKVHKSDSGSVAPTNRDLENSLETEFSKNATTLWRQHLESIDKNENIPPTSSERRHTMGGGCEWNAGLPTLPRLNLESLEKETTKKNLPPWYRYMLKSEDEPDFIEWECLEKAATTRSTSDTMFGGARRTSLSSVNSNVSLENTNGVPLRKPSLGTSSTTFSSFHPQKQESFGLHSIAENDQRVEEIRRRNTLCLPHLKSSYALEELKQVVPDEELKKPVRANTENLQPSINRSITYNRRKSPRKKFPFISTVSPSARRMRLKAETPTKRSHWFTVNLNSDKSSQKSDLDSLTSCEESTHKKTKGVVFSVEMTPKKALSKLGFNRKKKDDK